MNAGGLRKRGLQNRLGPETRRYLARPLFMGGAWTHWWAWTYGRGL